MNRKILMLFLLAPFVSGLGNESILNNYVQQGLKNNLALQQKDFSLKQAQAGLNQAKGMFLPALSLEARYSRAGGGRQIEIPIRDLTEMMGQIFLPPGTPVNIPPQIQNVSEPFLREKEHETKIRVVQPVFQPKILWNYQLQREMKEIEAASKSVFVRTLVADIKTAYFNYLKASQIVNLMDKTQDLLEENVRVSQSLFENDKVTKSIVYRAEAELHAFRQQQAEAVKGKVMAGSYFNFLLNRELSDSIEVASFELDQQSILPNLSNAMQQALAKREELQQLDALVQVMDKKVKLNQADFLPGVSAVVDYGYQGETYSFGKDDDYWMASLVASWNLFNGFQDKFKIDQSKLEKKQVALQYEELQHRIRLQVQDAYQNLIVAIQQLDAAQAGQTSARQSFRMIDRQYREGMVSQIEYIDARNAKTQAEVNAIVSQYDYFIRKAEWEKIIADYPVLDHDQ